MGRAILGIVVAGLLLAVAGCSDDEQDDIEVSGMTPEEFLQRVQEALTKPDQVAVIEAEAVAEIPGQNPDTLETTKAWLQLPGHARIEQSDRGGWDEQLHIIVGDRMYARFSTGSTATIDDRGYGAKCVPSDVDYALAQVACGFSKDLLPRADPRVESRQEFDGRPTVALVTERTMRGTNNGVPEELRQIHRFHVDPKTFQPVGTEGFIENRPDQGRMETTYKVSFVPAASLPAGFMEPAAVLEADAIPTLVAGIPPEALLRLIEKALTKADQVAYVESVTTFEQQGARQQLEKTKAWLALPGSARIEVADNTLHLIQGDRTYSRWADGETNTTGKDFGGRCVHFEADFAVAQVACGFRAQMLPFGSPRVEQGTEFHGRRTIALVTEGGSVNLGTGTTDFTIHRFHVDPETFLPVGTEMEFQGRPDLGRWETMFGVSFVPAASLPAGFMEPEAVQQQVSP